MTTVSEVMTRGARTIIPQEHIGAAAQLMEQMDVGSLPVCDGDKLVGILTDRDLVVRGLARRASLEGTQVNELMSSEVASCYADQPVEEVLQYMGGDQIRRLPVLDREHKLVGMVTLGDIAIKQEQPRTDEALAEISADLPQ